MWPVVSTGRTNHAQGYRSGLVGPVLVGFQASLALVSNQALRRDAAVLNPRYTAYLFRMRVQLYWVSASHAGHYASDVRPSRTTCTSC